MGKEWFKTESQLEYLEDNVQAFRDARAAAHQEPFFKTFVGGWLDRWPESTALFDDSSPDKPPLTTKQLAEVGVAMEKRCIVSLLPFTLPHRHTRCGMLIYESATQDLDKMARGWPKEAARPQDFCEG